MTVCIHTDDKENSPGRGISQSAMRAMNEDWGNPCELFASGIFITVELIQKGILDGQKNKVKLYHLLSMNLDKMNSFECGNYPT